jgi:hypothetical protein
MTVSLFILLVLCIKNTISVAATMLLTAINLAAWSDRLCIMGDVEDELNFILSTKTLSIAALH